MYGICDFQIPLTMEEEATLQHTDYTKLNPSLEEFGLGDMSLWFKKCDKTQKSALSNVNKLVADLQTGRDFLKDKPNDKTLLKFVETITDKLQAAGMSPM